MWEPHHDDLLRAWKKQAAINLWLALASKYRYDIINNWLTYPCIIISASTSIGILGIDFYTAGKYVMSTAIMASAILGAISKHFGAAEKSQEFYTRSKDYFALIRELDYLLGLHFEERGNVVEVLTRLKMQFDRILDLQLEPPLDIIRLYEQKFKPLENSLLDLQNEMRDEDAISDNSLSNIAIQMPFTNVNKKSALFFPYQLYDNTAVLSPSRLPTSQRVSLESVFTNNVRIPPTPRTRRASQLFLPENFSNRGRQMSQLSPKNELKEPDQAKTIDWSFSQNEKMRLDSTPKFERYVDPAAKS